MEKVIGLLNEKNFVINSMMVKILDKNLPLSDFLVLMYLVNDYTKGLDVTKISKTFNMKEEEVLGSFNNLVNKGLVTMETSKDLDGRMDEVVSLDGLYQIMAESLQGEEKKVEIDNVFNVFEQEFGRPLTPTEAELINGWLDTGISEELIKGALSEATYNGVRSFRYIDKIIYEWKKKGFKTMDDVNKNLRGEDKKKDSNNEELFDYDWLHDDE